MVDIHYQVTSLTRWAEFTFWPYLLGSRWEDLEQGPDVDVCLFAGAISTEADRQAALKLREKSRIMVACGSCAAFGGLPGLTNLAPVSEEAAEDVQEDLRLPGRQTRVSSLSSVVRVDYVVPGCAPTQNLLWTGLQSLVCGGESPNRMHLLHQGCPNQSQRA